MAGNRTEFGLLLPNDEGSPTLRLILTCQGERRASVGPEVHCQERHKEYDVANYLHMWQALLMGKSKVTAREKSRQENERAKSIENRSRQLMKKAGELQLKAQRADIRKAVARVAKQAGEET